VIKQSGIDLRGTVNLPGAVLLPRQTLLAAPQAGDCSWHLLLECQTAFFYERYNSKNIRDSEEAQNCSVNKKNPKFSA